MRREALALLIVLQAAAAAAQQLPNLKLTPGVTRPLSTKVVCGTKWGKDARAVTLSMKRQVFAAYGIPWSEHAAYEVDHLVSRELAGADDVKNLWPEPWHLTIDGKEMGARQKDRAENATHKAVCAGTISLKDAQDQIAVDWTILYERFVGEFPPAVARSR